MTNIITACFGGTQYANTRPAWLIDHGMVLQIKGVDLPEAYFVDFANSKAEQATRVLGNADGVVIPDQYFLSNAPQIFAWVYLTTGSSGFTTLQVTIPLAQRPDVTDVQPTPQETDLIEQAIAALNDGVERAETAADDAEQSAEGVAESEANAAESARLAKLSEDNAKESEDNAAASERNASLSARAATASEEAAAASERNAESSATAAGNSATAAGNAEEAAQAAQTGAEEAQRKAEDAQDAAEAAAQSIAQSAAQIAQNTSDIADLQDAVDTMQPAATASDVGKALIVKTVADGKPTEYEYGEAGGGGDATNYAPVIINSASGAIASFADGADNMPVKQLTVNVEPIQDLHGYDSPWPAGGGKNKLPNIYTTQTINDVTFTVYEDGSIKVNGTASARVDYYLSGSASGGSLVLPEGNYTISYGDASLSTNGLYMQFQKNGTGTTIYGSATFEAAELGWIRLIITSVGAVINNVMIYPMIRFTSVTDSTFQPYSNICPISGRTSATIYHSGADTSDPTNYTIQLGDTVYGGTLDVTQGKMVVDRAMVDMGTIPWRKQSSQSAAGGSVFSITVPSVGAGMAERVRYAPNTAISNIYATASSSVWFIINLPDLSLMVNTNTLYVADSRYTDAASFRAAIFGAQLVYELASPIEITLTPTQIDTLLGTNNIWSDAGDVSVDYRADTKLYIDNIHHPTDDDMTADAQIASGKYFIVGGNLYKSTTVIPAGDTIRPGTNCIKTNLAEALNALNA